jgi:tripartite-type tricarboxylate transporter receptor subunit TctC
MPALGNVVLQPLLSKSGGADLLARLRPVSMVSTSAHVLVVSAKLPVKSVRELVDYARANPGKVSFASAGTGGTAHLAMEMFKALSATDVLHVPYKGSSGAVNDLASGQVSAMFSSLPSLQGVADKGLVRVIAATAPSTSTATRSLPLMSAALPGFEYTTWYAMYVPQATPTALVERINAALRRGAAGPRPPRPGSSHMAWSCWPAVRRKCWSGSSATPTNGVASSATRASASIDWPCEDA